MYYAAASIHFLPCLLLGNSQAVALLLSAQRRHVLRTRVAIFAGAVQRDVPKLREHFPDEARGEHVA
jgi:hypothetical protein